MRSVCFFASYFTGNNIPYYITVYLKELKKHFTDVVFLTSQKNLSVQSIEFLKTEAILFSIEENEGFDFGMWYKAFQKTDVEKWDQIALVNDSCVLFKSLHEFMSWSRSDKSDMQGMTYSEAIAPHLQSYFLIINKKAIKPVKDFFDAHKIVKQITDVIKTYEVGLSIYLVTKGFKINAYMNRNGAESEFSPYYDHVKEHLLQGIPLIKKKILFSSYRKDELFTLARMNFDIDVTHYVQVIKHTHPELILSFDALFKSEPNRMGVLTRTKYQLMQWTIQLYRKLK